MTIPRWMIIGLLINLVLIAASAILQITGPPDVAAWSIGVMGLGVVIFQLVGLFRRRH